MMFLSLLALAGVGLGLAVQRLRRRGLDRWLPSYLLQTAQRRARRPRGEVHLLLCVADHFEPKVHGATPARAQARVQRWVEEYPRRFGGFRDDDGLPPQHTFFYPLEEYEPDHIDALAGLCRQGFGEVEVHLHHDRDTADSLKRKLLAFKTLLAERHGLLARHRHTGELGYGFIHGNWCWTTRARTVAGAAWTTNWRCCARRVVMAISPCRPCRARPRRARSTASTMPGAGQACRKSHDQGIAVGSGPAPAESLLLVQGPLLLNWRRRKWGLVPRIENGCLQASQPPSIARLPLWLRAGVQVPSRPDWFFVKLHTHGAAEINQDILLGEPMVRFHQALSQMRVNNPQFHFHYVTAREVVNLVKAAESGWTGSVAEVRDHLFVPNAPAVQELPGARN